MSSTPPRTPPKRKAPEAPSTPPTVSAKGQGAASAPPTTPPTTLVSPAEPRPKKQNVSREAVFPVSQDDEEERGAVAAAAATTLALPQLVPGRDGRVLSAELMEKCPGGCFRCKLPGHFASNCPLDGVVFPVRRNTICPGCGGRLAPPQLGVKMGDSWGHPRCAIGRLVQQREERKLLKGAPTAEADEAEAVLEFMRSGDGHALVEAGAGSGKTRLLVNVAKDCAKRGDRALVLVYNKAAEQELEKRRAREASTFEARTFHALGLAAWKAHMGERRVTVDLKVKKSVLLLHALYPPSRPDGGPKAKVSLTWRVFRDFVDDLVSAAKIRCVGVESFANDVEGLREIADTCPVYGKRLEKRCSNLPRRVRDWVKARWPTRASLSKRGLELAVEVLAANRETARSANWMGRTHLANPYSKARRELPLLDGADMLYMALADGIQLDPDGEKPISVLLVDEAQDSNAARREMCRRLQQDSGCRVVAVGDGMQAIYAFCGADHEALALFAELFGGTIHRFPLSTCYRCPRSHVELANSVIDKVNAEEREAAAREGREPELQHHIRSKPGASAGEIVRNADFTTQPLPNDASHGAVVRYGVTRRRGGPIGILARTNAPLLALRDCLAVRHVAVRFEGIQTLAQKLKRTLAKIGAQTFEELKDYLEAESMASSAGHHDPFRDDGEGSDDDNDVDPDGEDEPKLSTRFQAHDMRACLAVVIERLEYERQGTVDLADVERRINLLFERDTNLPPDRQAEQVVLSTVHRAKGLEWDTVYLLQPDDLPLEHVMEWGSPVDRRQERNVEYVAYTRAKRKLVFLRNLSKCYDDPWASVIDGLFDAPPPSLGEEPAPRAPEQEPWEDQWRSYWQSENGAADEPAPASEAWGLDPPIDDDLALALGLKALPATRAELTRAYRLRVLDVHPDKQMQKPVAERLSPEDAGRLFNEATNAYEFLKETFDDDVCD